MKSVESVLKKLKNNKYKISFAESATGGFLAYLLVSLDSASDVFNNSYVVYSDESKKSFFNIDQEFINKFGYASKEIVTEMVNGLEKLTSADVYVSVSGYLGNKGFKKVFVAIKIKEAIYIYNFEYQDERKKAIEKVCLSIYKKIDELI